jgi:DNA-binding FadR family transcriptional regulator
VTTPDDDIPASATADARRLARDLRRQIVTGELAVGTRLAAEPELQEQFDVSRATLRSAFRVLEAEGLVRIHRGARGGAEVTHPSADAAARYFGLVLQSRRTRLEDFAYARTVLEPHAAALAAQHATPADVARLKAALDTENQALASGDIEMFLEATVAFHGLVAEIGGSSTLWVIMDLVDGVLQRHAEGRIRSGRATDPELRKDKTHAQLLDRIAGGDVVGAREVWAKHAQSLGTAMVKNSPGRDALLFG